MTKVEPIPRGAEEIADGYYAITRSADIYRVIPNMGTWSGRKLAPTWTGRQRRVTLHYEDRKVNIDVDLMAEVTFRRLKRKKK